MRRMRTRAIELLALVFSICYAGPCSAGDSINAPLRIVEFGARQGGFASDRTLDNGRILPAGDFNVKAKVLLPLVDQPIAFERRSLQLSGGSGLVTLSVPSSAKRPATSGPPGIYDSSPNLLDADELWLTYQQVPGLKQCGLSIDIKANGIGYDKSWRIAQATATPLNLFSYARETRSAELALDGVRVFPRDIAYLIKSRTGASYDPNWRFVKEKHRHVYMRLLRVDLRDIESLELEMNSSVDRVNFRISRADGGKPTDVLDWDVVPKDIVIHGQKRWVHLDLARAIRQQMPGALEGKDPLALVEMIAYEQDGNVSSAVEEAPVRSLRVTYATPVATTVGNVELPSQIVRVAPDKMRLKMSLMGLRDSP